jgi:hypothetical protein
MLNAMLAKLPIPTFEEMSPDFILKWAIIFCFLLAVIIWHALHNHHTLSLRTVTSKDIIMLKRVALLRSLGIIMLCICCFFLVMVMDAQHHSEPRTSQQTSEIKPPLASDTSTPTTLSTTNLPIVDENTIKEALAVYAEDKLDDIKARYEDNFVSYLYLLRCNQIKETDYTIILQALKNELHHFQITTDPTKEIYSAAQGSYDLLYSEASCAPETMTPVLEGYRSAIMAMQKLTNTTTPQLP